MKKLKRVLSGILIFVLLFTLSACGSTNTDASASDETKSTSAASDGTKDASAAGENSTSEGVTIKVGVVGDQSAIWNPIIETLTFTLVV